MPFGSQRSQDKAGYFIEYFLHSELTEINFIHDSDATLKDIVLKGKELRKIMSCAAGWRDFHE